MNPALKKIYFLRTFILLIPNRVNAREKIQFHHFLTNDNIAIILDGCWFGFYTLNYEYNTQIFYTPIAWYFYYVVAYPDGVGLDDAGYGNDEIFDCLWRSVIQFYVSYFVDDTVHCIYYNPVCGLYRGDIRLQ